MVQNKSLQGLQDKILQNFCDEEIPVYVYLTNGIRLQGQIHSFDNYALFLKGGSNQMVYKHAIATIMPGTGIEIEELS